MMLVGGRRCAALDDADGCAENALFGVTIGGRGRVAGAGLDVESMDDVRETSG